MCENFMLQWPQLWQWRALLTCPSFCMRVQRSRTSVPHWAAACTHAWAYCPAAELWRLRGCPGKRREEALVTFVGLQPKNGLCDDIRTHRGETVTERYLSKCTPSPRLPHEQVEGWWRSLCLLTLQLKPEAWWSASGYLNTPAQGHAVGRFYLHDRNSQKGQKPYRNFSKQWLIIIDNIPIHTYTVGIWKIICKKLASPSQIKQGH